MAKEKNVKKEVVEKKEILTNAAVFQKLAIVASKDREELAEKMIKYLADKGVTKNIKGKTIDKPHLLQQISAIVKNINTERGKEKGSWWSQLKVIETDTEFKIVPR